MVAALAAIRSEGSVRAAAVAMGVSKATVSRHIQGLEDALEVRLLLRSTRQLSLSEEGERLVELFQPLAEAWNATIETVTDAARNPGGTVRVTAPEILCSTLLAPAIEVARQRARGLCVEVLSSDGLVDLIDGSVDLAVRTSPLRDSEISQQKLGSTREVAVCAPKLLEAYAEEHLRDRAPWVRHSSPSPPPCLWKPDGTRTTAGERVVVTTQSSEMFLRLLLDGAGVGIVPRFFVRQHLHVGRLVALPLYGREVSVHLLIPAGRAAPARVSEFAAAIREVARSTFDPSAPGIYRLPH